MSLRVRAIVNPRSGGTRTAKRWPQVEQAMQEVFEQLSVVRTDGPGAATRLAREALDEGMELVIAVGGDGTVNEVVNGFFDGSGTAVSPKAQLGIMMMGTGGDFRRSFQIDDGWRACLSRLAAGTTRRIDVGRLELWDHEGRATTRIFDNIASCGVSGTIVAAVNSARWSKLLGGAFSFRWNTLLGLMRYRGRPVRLRIDDHYDQVVDLTLIAVCNGQFFGGGMHAAPSARLDDGRFDVLIIEGMGPLDFVRHSGHLTRGEHVDLPGVHVVRGQRVQVEPVDVQDVVLLDVDGEGPGRLPATFQILPGALQVRV